MARLIFLFLALLTLLGFVTKSQATTYIVGGSSGWDISTNIDSWTQDKHFLVGDVLFFQYSSSHSVAEVNRDSYQRCNTTDVLQLSSNGNTTFVLTRPEDRYFICGNKLHCYAGMKLHVVVDGKSAEAPAPAPAPGAPKEEAGDGSTTPTTTTTTPSSKSNNNPSSIVPGLAMSIHVGFETLVFTGFTCLLSWIV